MVWLQCWCICIVMYLYAWYLYMYIIIVLSFFMFTFINLIEFLFLYQLYNDYYTVSRHFHNTFLRTTKINLPQYFSLKIKTKTDESKCVFVFSLNFFSLNFCFFDGVRMCLQPYSHANQWMCLCECCFTKIKWRISIFS